MTKDRPDAEDVIVSLAEGAGLRVFHDLLADRIGSRDRGGLRCLPTKAADFLWLCERRFDEYEPPMPMLDR